MTAMSLTPTNGIVPLAVLIALCVLVPLFLARQTLSQRRLAAVMLLTALLVWMAGAGLMAWQYRQINGNLLAGIWAYFERALPMGLLYGPILALVWLVRAQGVERRRGLLMREMGKG